MSSKITKRKKETATGIPEGEFKIVSITDIDPSPFNYRKVFPAKKMEDLAASVAVHGIIENLSIRVLPSGRYELVAGERRLRAAKMAGLTEVPTIIRPLTDEQVREIQLTENLQREDPHPLEEATAIGQLQTTYKTIDEIALRLGKSKTFIYGRLKLLALIPDIQEMFIAEKFTMQEVLQIAALSPQSQEDFFNEHCTGWQEENDFESPDLIYVLNRYRFDLTNAPFNTRDKKLLPDIGACTKCPYNSATLTSLFPEEAKEAICTNTGCYQRKCRVHFSGTLRSALQEQQPAALIFYGPPSAFLKNCLEELPEATSLPQYSFHCITRISEPQLPLQDDYYFDPETGNDGPIEELDTEGFSEAMEEYKADREEYDRLIGEGDILKGLLVTERQFTPCLFRPDTAKPGPTAPAVTAADVQAAIKAGTVTPELLEAEIFRINTRETRNQALDREKVQAAVHAGLYSTTTGETDPEILTDADQTALRLLLLQSMDYDSKKKVMDKLFPGLFKLVTKENEDLYDSLGRLTDSQCSYLIRMALLSKPEGKNPHTESAYFLYQVATSAGVNVAAIEEEQKQKADTRQHRQKERIEALQKKIKKLRPEA